eukprot:6207922-Pleurochrysis_carterae.AAC.5
MNLRSQTLPTSGLVIDKLRALQQQLDAVHVPIQLQEVAAAFSLRRSLHDVKRRHELSVILCASHGGHAHKYRPNPCWHCSIYSTHTMKPHAQHAPCSCKAPAAVNLCSFSPGASIKGTMNVPMRQRAPTAMRTCLWRLPPTPPP